jgi:hypothetical protein
MLVPQFRLYFPSFEARSCFLNKDQILNGNMEQNFRLHIYLTVQVYLILNFIFDALLMILIYALRKVQAEFSMTSELLTVTLVQFVVGFIIYFYLVVVPESLVSRTNAIQYIMLARGFIFLYVSAIKPLRESFSANAIIPFPINEECIKTLEMALLMPTSANYFYEYLETLCNSEKTKDALVYFGLYADIRTYLRLVEEQGAELNELRAFAQQILVDYVGDGGFGIKPKQWEVEIPAEVLSEMRSIMDPLNPGRLSDDATPDEHLFSSLYYFVLDVLEAYYKDFQRSRKYEQLKDEVAK